MDNKQYIDTLCREAKAASRVIANYSTVQKNEILGKIAVDLRKKADFIVAENNKDLKAAEEEGISKALYDRLLLNRERINGMAVSIEEIAMLDDPIGRIEKMMVRPSGIQWARCGSRSA